MAAELGQLLLRALDAAQVGAAPRDAVRSAFPLRLPPDDGIDPTGRRRLAVLAATSLDGTALAAALGGASGGLSSVLSVALPAAAQRQVDRIGRDWLTATGAIFSEPAGAAAWQPSRLEYRFAVSTTTAGKERVVLTADEYRGGRLEWHDFDWGSGGPLADDDPQVVAREGRLLPMPLRFRGMPASRFWEFENAAVSLGAVDAAPEDLARLAVAGYAALYGDDWYLIPLRLPVGSVAQVGTLEVLDDFGGVTQVPAAAALDGPRRAFRWFELSGDPGPGRPDPEAPLLLVPPTVETTDAARPLEDVQLMRDEAANLAWAVESRVESAAGRAVDLAARLPPPAAPVAVAADRWRFALATGAPQNWVPLVPIRLGAGGAIALQRGRIATSAGARGRVLLPEHRLVIHEEEIPAAGVRVVRRFQSARGADGRLHVWVGRRKGPGRGAGQSGLAFDVISPESGHSER